MTTFDDRKRGQEAKYAHDQETEFKVIARRNKLLGLWAAEKLGLSGEEAQAYAKQVVISDFEKPGDDDVKEKVHGDFQDGGLDISEHRVRRHMDELLSTAREQILSE